MTGEVDPVPDIRDDLSGYDRRIRELEGRVSGEEDGIYLGQLVDVRTDGLVDTGITKDDGDVVTWDEARQLFVPKPIPTVAPTAAPVPVFSYPGTVLTGVESGRWYAPATISFGHLRLSARVAVTSDLIVDINVNGSVADTITLTSGNATRLNSTSITVSSSDSVTVSINTAGDAVDMTCELLP